MRNELEMVSKLFMSIAFQASAAVPHETSGREKKANLGCLQQCGEAFK
jgi:hypothetical protein